MQNRKNLHACSGHLGSNCTRLAAKLQTHMQNFHALVAKTMLSHQYFAMTLGEQTFE